MNYRYRELKTNEIVEDFMAEDYALTELGLMEKGQLVIKPKGNNGTFTLQQLENIKETVDWFFSGNWIKEEDK